MMKKRGKYRKAVFVVVYRKTKTNEIEYLILKRKLHWKGWEFSKGGLENRETMKKAVAREVKEETGLKALNIKKYNKSGKYKYHKILKDRPGFIGQTYSLYSAEIKRSKVKMSKKEHSSYKWVDFDKAIKMLKWPNQKMCLMIVNSSL